MSELLQLLKVLLSDSLLVIILLWYFSILFLTFTCPQLVRGCVEHLARCLMVLWFWFVVLLVFGGFLCLFGFVEVIFCFLIPFSFCFSFLFL